MNVGERIARLRKQRGKTQSELAADLFVSPKTVSKWENGYGLPDIKTLPKLAEALGVNCEYLLTGNGGDIKPPAETKPSSVNETESVATPPKPNENGAYKLHLYQVTHNHLTKWLLLFNIIILILSLVSGPIDVKIEGSEKFGTMTVLSALYPAITDRLFQDGWMIAIGALWIIAFLFIIVSTLVMLLATLNGTNEYYVKISVIQFTLLLALLLLSVVGSYASNVREGETVMKPTPLFAALTVAAFIQIMLNVFVSRHGKSIRGLKPLGVGGVALLVCLSLLGSFLPQRAIADKLDESSVGLSELNFFATETKGYLEGSEWFEYDVSGILAVKANVKITYLYDCNTYYSADNYTQTLFAQSNYIDTEYKNRFYYNFFRINFSASTNGPYRVSEFGLSFKLSKDGKEFSPKTNTGIAENVETDFATEIGRFTAIDSEYAHTSVEFQFTSDVTVIGYRSTAADINVTVTPAEYTSTGSIGNGREVYEKNYPKTQLPLLESGSSVTLNAALIKHDDSYEKLAHAIFTVNTNDAFALYERVQTVIITNNRSFEFSIRFDAEILIEAYMGKA